MLSSSCAASSTRISTRPPWRSTRDHSVSESQAEHCYSLGVWPGEWHQERLCNEREFLKEAQQNYQSYQGMWVGKEGWSTDTHIDLIIHYQTTPALTAWVLSVTTEQTSMLVATRFGGQTMCGPASCLARVIIWRSQTRIWAQPYPGNSLICGFETKGHTAFPDNSEIDRVKFFCCDPDYQP